MEVNVCCFRQICKILACDDRSLNQKVIFQPCQSSTIPVAAGPLKPLYSPPSGQHRRLGMGVPLPPFS